MGTRCNSTISNMCMNGQCWCGKNQQCSQTIAAENDQGLDCNPRHCDYDSNSMSCLTVRTDQEVCEKITSNYNPLYIPQKIVTSDGSNALICDDRKGKYLDEYMCLGMRKFSFN